MRHVILLVLVGIVFLVLWALTGGCAPANGAPEMPFSQSNVSYLQKVRNGVVFSEGFENDNFIAAEGWNILQGSPANTGSQYVGDGGIKSWDNQANGGSIPVAKKIISGVFDTSWMIRVWFYDTMNTSAPGPYVKVKLSDGNYLQVGVRNAVSTTSYVTNPSGTYTDSGSNFSATIGMARSLGWHFFDIVATPGTGFGQGLAIVIDGVNSQTMASLYTSQTPTEIWLQADAVGGPGPSFGFFDSLGCYSSNYIIFKSSNSSFTTINQYDSSNNLINSSASFSAIPGRFPIGSSVGGYPGFQNVVLPLSAYYEISYPGNNTAILFRTRLLQVNPGDIYQIVSTGFGRKLTKWNPQNNVLANVNQSTAGVTETLFNAYKNKYSISVKELAGLSNKESIDEWYNYAAQGNPFSIQVDDQNAALGILSGAPTVGQNSVWLMQNLSVNPTDAFTVGRQYVIANAANTLRQSVTVTETNPTGLQFDNNINWPFQQGDYIADMTFHPFLELGNNAYGLAMMDERYLREDWNQVVQEYSGG
jgi:hypothetical protein